MLNQFEGISAGRGVPSGGGGAGASGAEEVFDAVFRANYAGVLRFALRRSAPRAAAEDIAAETFAVAWRRFDAMPADVLPWLLGIARHLILNEQSSERRRARLVTRLSAAQDTPVLAAAESSQDVRDVLDALARLGERDQEVLRLTAWGALAMAARQQCSGVRGARWRFACIGLGGGWMRS